MPSFAELIQTPTIRSLQRSVLIYPKTHKVTSQNTESVTTNPVPVQLITPNSPLAEPVCIDYQYEACSSFLNASIPMKHGGSFRNFPIQFPP